MSTDGTRGLSAALSSLVAAPVDVSDVLARLVSDAAGALGAAAAAVLALDDHDLALLASTTHGAGELEMLQAQLRRGPCVDALASGRPVRCLGAARLVERWDSVGAAIVTSGFDGVVALPLRWRDRPLGSLGLFFAGEATPSDDLILAQAHADLAALVLVQSDRTEVQVAEQLERALDAREIVEIAKGVLAEREGLTMEESYRRLLELAATSDAGLSEVAAAVVGTSSLTPPVE